MTKYRDAYYPGTEELGPNEMRVTALGTGMPNLRPSQMSASWFVELGNGDKFFFDMGTGSISNFCKLGFPYDLANKVFLSHLHSDHCGDFAAWYIGGWVDGRQTDVHVWGPSGDTPEMGTKFFLDRGFRVWGCPWNHLVNHAAWERVVNKNKDNPLFLGLMHTEWGTKNTGLAQTAEINWSGRTWLNK